MRALEDPASAWPWERPKHVMSAAVGRPAGAVFTMALLGILASKTSALRALAVDPSRLMREE
jgi:hypothetical protein